MQSNVSYNHETVALDGETFSNCTFQSCRLVFGGEGAPTFEACRFHDCEWRFEGAAAETMACLKRMWTAAEKAAVQTMIKDVTAAGR